MEGQTQRSFFGNNEGKLEEAPNTKDLNARFSELLQYVKVIRDSVHGDIWITKTEKSIIDTPVFQRLRRIKQLGATDLVYPSAKHTRFEHSIGTLHVAQLIIEAVNKNYRAGLSKSPISAEDAFITRIVALIHDLAHVPYGHTVEAEGNLFRDGEQWLDKDRKEYFLGKVLPMLDEHLSEQHIPPKKIEEVDKEIEHILLAEESKEEEIHKLERPYIADIVGNTICADLLDYLKRDAYNAGLQITYDPRILSYFVLEDYTKGQVTKLRLSILLERRDGTERRDILSECVSLLRLRYSLAEKVYYHRVKSMFSALVIRMIYCAKEGGILTKRDLMCWGDDVLVDKILSFEGGKDSEYVQAARRLAGALLERKLFRDIYSAAYTSEDIFNKLSRYIDKDERYGMERYLEDLFSVDPGSVVIYAPKVDEGKVAETKMLRGIWEGRPYIKRLTDLSKEYNHRSTVGKEIETLEDLYKSLWKFYVLLDATCVRDEEKERLEGVCKEVLEDGKLGENAVLLRCDKRPDIELTFPQIEEVCHQLQEKETHPRLLKEPSKFIDGLLLQSLKEQSDA